MNYLSKLEDSIILVEKWVYSTKNHRKNLRIRNVLLEEQRGYCAYTEDFMTPTHAVDVEHFDDRLKNTANDNYWNYYAVNHRWNSKKRSIVEFLPIMQPYDVTLKDRVFYADGEFQVVDEGDIEAKNLISFLSWNDPSLAECRADVVATWKDMRDELFHGDEDKFIAYLRKRPENLRFITVLRVELGIDL